MLSCISFSELTVCSISLTISIWLVGWLVAHLTSHVTHYRSYWRWSSWLITWHELAQTIIAFTKTQNAGMFSAIYSINNCSITSIY